MMMTSTVSEESLAREHTHRLGVVYVKICKVTYDFASKKCSYFKLLCVLISFLNARQSSQF